MQHVERYRRERVDPDDHADRLHHCPSSFDGKNVPPAIAIQQLGLLESVFEEFHSTSDDVGRIAGALRLEEVVAEVHGRSDLLEALETREHLDSMCPRDLHF